MRLPGYAVQIALTLLFFVGAGARFSATGETSTPYLSGESAMNYHHTMMVADGKSLNEKSVKAAWPEGYVPAREGAVGIEATAGVVFRVMRYFGAVDGRRFVRRLVVFLFSLCVLTMYMLARELWDCQASGLIAAFFVAVFPPLVDATNGREFAHTPIAVLLATLHLLFLLRQKRTHGRGAGIVSAVLAFVLLSAWEVGPYYVAAIAVYVAFAGSYSQRERVWVGAAHAAALVAAALLLPWGRALHLAGAWPVWLAISCAGVSALGERAGGMWRRAAVIAGAALVLTLVMAPVRAGADASVDVLRYLVFRLRHPGGPPVDPLMVPEPIRNLWTTARSAPAAHMMISFFLPMGFLAAAAALQLRAHKGRRCITAALGVALLAALVYLVDRGAVIVATVAVVLALCVAGRSVSQALRSRGVLLAMAALLAVVDLLYPLAAANPAFAIARARHVARRDPNRFVWVSMQNTNLDLVRFVSTRTSTRDAFLGPPETTALLLAFAGRTSVPLAGAVTDDAAARTVSEMALFYGSEEDLYAACDSMGVAWVLYSVDLLLDTSRYSPRYLAGVRAPDLSAVVWRMHFEPHTLQHLTLVQENDHYRLFRVTGAAEPSFLTDHPPVYQREPFAYAREDMDAFRQLSNELLITYAEAQRQLDLRSPDVALRMLSWCLERAPRFTRARITAARTLMQMGHLDEARTAIDFVLEQAPDNPDALYTGAYIHAQLEEPERARALLEILFTTTNDPGVIERARLLESFIDRGISVVPGAPIPSDTASTDTTQTQP